MRDPRFSGPLGFSRALATSSALPALAELRQDGFASSRSARLVWPFRRSSLCHHHAAAVARKTRKTPVCIGLPFIGKSRLEPVLAKFIGPSPHGAMPASLSKPLIWNNRGIWGCKVDNEDRRNLAQDAKLPLICR